MRTTAADPTRVDLTELWNDPIDLEKRDLFAGPTLGTSAPDATQPFAFIEADSSGFSPGYDLRAGEPFALAPGEAPAGASFEVQHPAGRVEGKVPAVSSNGRKLRLKGRGIPGDPAGDLYLELELSSPAATTEKEREVYRTMAREFSSFNPREQAGGQR